LKIYILVIGCVNKLKTLESDKLLKDFKKNAWLFTIIGSFVALISLFTPATTWNRDENFAIQWMFQLGLRLEPYIEFGLWRTQLGLLILSIILSAIIFISAITIIIVTVIFKRTSRNFQKLRWGWLLVAIIITLSTLGWIIMMEINYNSHGINHWSIYGGNYSPSFGVIGTFIGSVLIIVGFILQSISNNRDGT